MGKIRISFCKNTGNDRGKEISGALVNQTYNDIAIAARNKLKIKSKNIKLFVARKTSSVPAGYELTEENINCLTNDMVICISQGEDFLLAKDKKGESCSINCPFIFTVQTNVYTTPQNNNQESNDQKIQTPSEPITFEKLPPPYQNFEMNNIFPVFEGNIVPYLKEIAREPNSIFVENDFGLYSSFDYKSSNAPKFDDPKKLKNSKDIWMAGVKRECRGLIVCNKTGNILARRFHKYFNINENDEANIDNITLTSGALLTEKIDGSLVSPFILNDQIVWGTRNSIQDQISVYVSLSKSKYNVLGEYCIKNLNSTPLFEWCETDRVISVVEHKQLSLTLLAVRNMKTGDYMPYDQMCDLAEQCDVPYVQQIKINSNDINEVVKEIINVPEKEGVVLRLENSEMYKIKTVWYTSLMQAAKNGGKKNSSFLLELIKKRPIINDIPIYRIYDACLDYNLDDHISMCCTLLQNANAKQEALYLQKIASEFTSSISHLHHKLLSWVEEVEKSEKSETIIQAIINAGWPNLLGIAYVKNKYSAKDTLTRKIKELCTYRYYQELEKLLQISFNKTNIVISDHTFNSMPDHIKDHVLERYLPAKIKNYLGIQSGQLNDNTIINIPTSYGGSEGKMKGLWEMFEDDGIIDLRVDLQPPKKIYDEHFGDQSYAMWQVQYGINPKCKKSSGFKKGCEDVGVFGGILVPTNKNIPYSMFKEALEQSFKTNQIVQINKNYNFDPVNINGESNDMNDMNNKKYMLYCDLDGVLVDFEKGVFELTNKCPAQFINVGDMWKSINKKDNFWLDLSWTSDGKHLWDYILNNKNLWNCQVLTGVPSDGKSKKIAENQKKMWCEKNLNTNTIINTCLSNQKSKFSGKNKILIDDRLKYKGDWEKNGGIFIHHINTAQTIESLESLSNTNYYVMPPELIINVDDQTSEYVFLGIATDEQMNIMAFDVEWRPDEIVQSIYPDCHSLPSLIQIAFNHSSKVFLIDCLKISEKMIDILVNILQNIDVKKVCFGIKEDISRFLALLNYYGKNINTIPSVIDIHNGFCQQYNVEKVTLRHVIKQLLGLQIEKNKFLQVSDWELRPLSLSQQKYAAMDAHILMLIYKQFEKQNIIMDTQCINIGTLENCSDFDKYMFSTLESLDKEEIFNLTPLCRAIPSQEINFEYTGLFLTKQSRILIMELFPPLYNNRYADHVTIIHKNNNDNQYQIIKNQMMGETESFVIIGGHTDSKCQTLIVKLLNGDNNALYHITVSTVPGVSPSYGYEISQKEIARINMLKLYTPINKNVFTGRIGTMISLDKGGELLMGLADKTKKLIVDLVENGENGSKIKFNPGFLSSNERKIIHDFADFYKLTSESEGPKDNRQLILTKPKKWSMPELTEHHEKEKIIRTNDKEYNHKKKLLARAQEENITFRLVFDNTIFKDLTFKNIDSEISSQHQMHGNLDLEKGIVWNNNAVDENVHIFKNKILKNESTSTVIIMRGLPGAGKSTFCQMMKNLKQDDLYICSADQYFEKIGGFDENKLQEAHDYCRNNFIDALANDVPIVIVDNTNITTDKYQYYKRKAKEYVYSVFVVEMKCNNSTSFNRNIHQVPMQKINKMKQQWELDIESNVIRLISDSKFGLIKNDCYIPFSEQTLSQFLAEYHCIHNSFKKPQTHLLMSVGDQPARYLHIPKELENKFLECYMADTNGWFISEYATRPNFKFYLDVDYLGPIKLDIAKITYILHDVLLNNNFNDPCTLITGSQPILRDNNNLLQGYHLRCPNVIVDEETAFKIREQFVDVLNKYMELDWNKIIDESVIASRSLRMLWSRKTQKGVDVGRVQSLVHVIKNKQINTDILQVYQTNPMLLLKDSSVQYN
jgi:predicted kinase